MGVESEVARFFADTDGDADGSCAHTAVGTSNGNMIADVRACSHHGAECIGVKLNEGGRIGYLSALAVNANASEKRDIPSIGTHIIGIFGTESKGDRFTRGLSHIGCQPFAVSISNDLQLTGTVGHKPLAMAKRFHLLSAKAFAIKEQFCLVAIRICPNFDILAQPLGEIPMGEQMNHRLFRPQ